MDLTVAADFQASDVAIAALAATAAVIAALIAAHSARTRQAQQLADERERADVAELRSVLDEAAMTLGKAKNALIAAEAELEVVVNFGTADATPLSATYEDLNALQDSVSGHAARIALRVGRDNDVYRTYESASVAMLTALVPFARAEVGRPTADDLAKLNRDRETVEKAHHEFLKVAELVVGSKIVGVEKTVAEQLDELRKT